MIRCVFLILFLTALVAAADIPETPALRQLLVTALDQHHRPLRSGPGFVWDEQTLFCSFSLVQGAAFLRTEAEGGEAQLDRILSYSRYFDLVALHTEGALKIENPLGSSDTTVKGDSVFVFVFDQQKWLPKSLTVQSWQDPGKGYQLILTEAPSAKFEPSPVYNAQGKAIGWMFAPGKILPARDMDRFVSGKSADLTLAQLISAANWEPKEVPAPSTTPAVLSLPETGVLRGTTRFPFEVSFPKNWKNQLDVREAQLVIRSWQEALGICLELRVIPEQDEDLPAVIEKTETLMFAGMRRCGFAPYSAKHIAGFLACYDVPDPSDKSAVSAFFGMLGKDLYVLTITYPVKWQDEVTLMMARTLDSLSPQSHKEPKED